MKVWVGRFGSNVQIEKKQLPGVLGSCCSKFLLGIIRLALQVFSVLYETGHGDAVLAFRIRLQRRG